MPRRHARPEAVVRRIAAALLVSMFVPAAQAAAQPAKADTATKAAPPPRAELSGVLFANFQYGGTRGARSANRFEVERAYLTVRGRLSERASIRVTADVYQQRDTARDEYYSGWAFRAKYAFLQYELLTSDHPSGFEADARLGMLHTVVIGHEQSFWPRWISNVGLERAGFFSSADVGAAVAVGFPRRLGEIYATVTNGPGYQSRETDRFKDAAIRLTMTPFGASSNAILRTLAISPWISEGARASRYAEGVGSIAPIPEARGRDRWGVLAGVGSPAVTAVGHYGVRREELESLVASGADSTVSARTESAAILSGFAILRPFSARPDFPLRPLGFLVRLDQIEDLDLGGERRAVIAGLLWEVDSRLSFALDYQEQTLRNQPVSASAARIRALDTRTWFLHAVAAF